MDMLHYDEHSALIPLKVYKVMQSKFYTLFILEGLDKKLPIYAEPSVGLKIQEIVSSAKKPRPHTFDLLSMILKGLDAQPMKAVIYDVEHNIFKVHLFLEQVNNQQKTVVKIDSRPSDCLTLALMTQLPLFCLQEAFDKAPAFQDQ